MEWNQWEQGQVGWGARSPWREMEREREGKQGGDGEWRGGETSERDGERKGGETVREMDRGREG